MSTLTTPGSGRRKGMSGSPSYRHDPEDHVTRETPSSSFTTTALLTVLSETTEVKPGT